MNEAPIDRETDPSPPFLLAYRLTDSDVRRYLASCRFPACKRLIRTQLRGALLLVVLGMFLVGACFRGHGTRPGMLALGTTAAILAGFAWWRGFRAGSCACRVARDLGVPCDLRLKVSARGIAKAPGRDSSDPGRSFAWSEVVAAKRTQGLFVFHLRPAGAVLLVPDRALGKDEAIADFARKTRAWLTADHPGPAGR